MQYLIGFDTELVEKAQVHIRDAAEEKRANRRARITRTREYNRKKKEEAEQLATSQ